MEELLVKTLLVVFFAVAWVNLGGLALFASNADREEEPWTLFAAIYVAAITVFTVAMIYFALTTHWQRTW